MARLSGLPHVLSLHGGDIFDPSKKLSPHRLPGVRAVVNWVLTASDSVVAQSTNTRDNAYRYYRYQGPIEIIPLGIRQPRVSDATRDELSLPRDRFLAITVGRLVKRKGIDQLLHCLTYPGLSNVQLVVVGSGPEADTLRRLAQELGVSHRVLFTGWVDETRKWQLLRCADAYVSATLHEGFGLVYLEAMAAGLPVVTFDHGGQVDFLRDGHTGYLVPLGNREGLAGAIEQLVENPQTAAEFGKTNLELAPNHRIEQCAAQYEALFERLLRDRPPDSRPTVAQIVSDEPAAPRPGPPPTRNPQPLNTSETQSQESRS